jgi:hypothetical protein
MDLSQSWAYIEQVAQHRLDHNKTERHVSEYGEYIEVIGAAGELAARRFLQLDENLHEHFDGGCDILYKGIRLDVKATVWTKRLTRRYLQWPIWKQIKADAILFTAINQDKKSAVIVGYALPHDIGRAPLNQARDIPCYEIPIPKLRKASGLLFAECRDDLYPFSSKTNAHQGQYGYRQGAGA